MCKLVSGRRLLIEFTSRIDILHIQEVYVVCKAWEENTGTENLANSKGPLMTSRTKHIRIKYHRIRLVIQKNKIEVNRIDTKHQKAYIFTKGLTRFLLENVRYQVMGW